jgi:hypothetical protein
MQTIRRLLLRASALTILAGGAALAAASGCNIIGEETDCNSACALFKTCGLPGAPSADCGGYCTELVAGAAVAGCSAEFEAQNQCAKDNSVCSTAMTCTTSVEAFATCMATFCAKTPSSSACSVISLQKDGGP